MVIQIEEGNGTLIYCRKCRPTFYSFGQKCKPCPESYYDDDGDEYGEGKKRNIFSAGGYSEHAEENKPCTVYNITTRMYQLLPGFSMVFSESSENPLPESIEPCYWSDEKDGSFVCPRTKFMLVSSPITPVFLTSPQPPSCEEQWSKRDLVTGIHSDATATATADAEIPPLPRRCCVAGYTDLECSRCICLDKFDCYERTRVGCRLCPPPTVPSLAPIPNATNFFSSKSSAQPVFNYVHVRYGILGIIGIFVPLALAISHRAPRVCVALLSGLFLLVFVVGGIQISNFWILENWVGIAGLWLIILSVRRKETLTRDTQQKKDNQHPHVAHVMKKNTKILKLTSSLLGTHNIPLVHLLCTR